MMDSAAIPSDALNHCPECRREVPAESLAALGMPLSPVRPAPVVRAEAGEAPWCSPCCPGLISGSEPHAAQFRRNDVGGRQREAAGLEPGPLADWFPAHIVYEAGFCGFWALRIFRQNNIDCIVCNPADIQTMNKERVNKCDPIDSHKLSRELENKSLHGILYYRYFPRRIRYAYAAAIQDHSISNWNKKQNQRTPLCPRIPIPLQFSGNNRWFLASSYGLRNFNCLLPPAILHSRIHYPAQRIRDHNKNVLKQLRKEARKQKMAPVYECTTGRSRHCLHFGNVTLHRNYRHETFPQ